MQSFRQSVKRIASVTSKLIFSGCWLHKHHLFYADKTFQNVSFTNAICNFQHCNVLCFKFFTLAWKMVSCEIGRHNWKCCLRFLERLNNARRERLTDYFLKQILFFDVKYCSVFKKCSFVTRCQLQC